MPLFLQEHQKRAPKQNHLISEYGSYLDRARHPARHTYPVHKRVIFSIGNL